MTATRATASAAAVVAFWRAAGAERWFKQDPAFDESIRQRFLDLHEAAAAGSLRPWEDSAEGALALLLLLDQFPRNMFRGEARAFSTDALARAIAAGGLIKGFDGQAEAMRGFFYLPFMHSEELADQQRAIALYRAAGDDAGVNWAKRHADIIRRFGRFPHRNAALGRQTTPEEQAFLDDGGFAG
jgi:uncharacterized protein (DUF924 family)